MTDINTLQAEVDRLRDETMVDEIAALRAEVARLNNAVETLQSQAEVAAENNRRDNDFCSACLERHNSLRDLLRRAGEWIGSQVDGCLCAKCRLIRDIDAWKEGR